MLAVDNLVASYNAGPVLQGVSLSVQAGEVVALLGRNGVGKSTLLRTLVGLVPSWNGSIRIDGTPLARIATHDIARMGMALVPQGRGIIGKLSVADNLRAAMRAAGSRPALSIDQAIAPFPALHRAHVAFQVRGDVLPRVQPIGRGLGGRSGVRAGGHVSSHPRAPSPVASIVPGHGTAINRIAGHSPAGPRLPGFAACALRRRRRGCGASLGAQTREAR